MFQQWAAATAANDKERANLPQLVLLPGGTGSTAFVSNIRSRCFCCWAGWLYPSDRLRSIQANLLLGARHGAAARASSRVDDGRQGAAGGPAASGHESVLLASLVRRPSELRWLSGASAPHLITWQTRRENFTLHAE